MAAQSENALAWQYTDDDGNTWTRRAKKAITDQVNGSSEVLVGGEAASTSDNVIKVALIRPRAVYCDNDTYGRKAVVCYDTTCDLWTTPGTTINLNCQGDSRAFVSTRFKLKERAIGRTQRIHQTT